MWNIFSGHAALEILKEIHIRMTIRRTCPGEFEERIIFMAIFKDIDVGLRREITVEI